MTDTGLLPRMLPAIEEDIRPPRRQEGNKGVGKKRDHKPQHKQSKQAGQRQVTDEACPIQMKSRLAAELGCDVEDLDSIMPPPVLRYVSTDSSEEYSGSMRLQQAIFKADEAIQKQTLFSQDSDSSNLNEIQCRVEVTPEDHTNFDHQNLEEINMHNSSGIAELSENLSKRIDYSFIDDCRSPSSGFGSGILTEVLGDLEYPDWYNDECDAEVASLELGQSKQPEPIHETSEDDELKLFEELEAKLEEDDDDDSSPKHQIQDLTPPILGTRGDSHVMTPEGLENDIDNQYDQTELDGQSPSCSPNAPKPVTKGNVFGNYFEQNVQIPSEDNITIRDESVGCTKGSPTYLVSSSDCIGNAAANSSSYGEESKADVTAREDKEATGVSEGLGIQSTEESVNAAVCSLNEGTSIDAPVIATVSAPAVVETKAHAPIGTGFPKGPDCKSDGAITDENLQIADRSSPDEIFADATNESPTDMNQQPARADEMPQPPDTLPEADEFNPAYIHPDMFQREQFNIGVECTSTVPSPTKGGTYESTEDASSQEVDTNFHDSLVSSPEKVEQVRTSSDEFETPPSSSPGTATPQDRASVCTTPENAGLTPPEGLSPMVTPPEGVSPSATPPEGVSPSATPQRVSSPPVGDPGDQRQYEPDEVMLRTKKGRSSPPNRNSVPASTTSPTSDPKGKTESCVVS